MLHTLQALDLVVCVSGLSVNPLVFDLGIFSLWTVYWFPGLRKRGVWGAIPPLGICLCG